MNPLDTREHHDDGGGRVNGLGRAHQTTGPFRGIRSGSKTSWRGEGESPLALFPRPRADQRPAPPESISSGRSSVAWASLLLPRWPGPGNPQRAHGGPFPAPNGVPKTSLPGEERLTMKLNRRGD